MNPIQRLRDWLLERRIAKYKRMTQKFALAGNRLHEHAAYIGMVYLIKQRSPQQVERMERRQGIFRGTN